MRLSITIFNITTLSIMRLSIMTFSTMALSIMTLSITRLNIMTFNKTTLSIKIIKCDTHFNNKLNGTFCIMTLSIMGFVLLC